MSASEVACPRRGFRCTSSVDVNNFHFHHQGFEFGSILNILNYRLPKKSTISWKLRRSVARTLRSANCVAARNSLMKSFSCPTPPLPGEPMGELAFLLPRPRNLSSSDPANFLIQARPAFRKR